MGLGAILRAIIELHGTTHWHEFSVMLWTLILKYREETRPEMIVLYPDERTSEVSGGT